MIDHRHITPETARLHFLMARARRAGYQLIAEPRQNHRWVLLDIDDGERLFESASLAEVEQYLSE
ncbi:hypothetical protein [Nocardia sp. 852002-20019_SCH5090214]|uniref:hypothetical protein n=1 Tax=Nocardia sp. 852002-20019_SCH5090214 TaxID=1834087 RepID=UPI000B146753|nr:hypothetical protein [Nocardia sp. 852002-20019_SCH5090214]